MPHLPIVLASASPRRVELLRSLIADCQVIPSDASEVHDAALGVRPLCELNARLKAAPVSQRHPGCLVLGADTLVWLEGQPLGKPANLAAARAMLESLSGKSHEVVTGVCLMHGASGRCAVFSDVTRVVFRHLDSELISRYLEVVPTLDKAGGYAIQGLAAAFVERIDGSYSGVVGLPLFETARLLQDSGVSGWQQDATDHE